MGKGTEFSFFLDHNKRLYMEGQTEHPGLVVERKVLARLARGRVFLRPDDVSRNPRQKSEKPRWCWEME